ncbi:hypothetical protein BGZ60DRAFT_538235 [Tricladium varicosporioides]|nr:hypothetical protein BGZ60DRAFT_538235 [Hymenoscyphus varicosporioides]
MSSNSTVGNPLAHNSASQGQLWVAVTIPVIVLTISIVAIRIWWRKTASGKITKSDITILVSLLCAIVQEILGCIAILKWGLGHHAAYIGLHKTQKALMIFYKTLVGTTKMSFIFLYLDLFPIRKFVWVCHGLNISVIAAIIAFDAGTIFQCTPIPYFWNRTIKGGHCIDSAAFWYGHAAWNTAVDILILILPIPVIRSLQMGNRQKWAVAGVFGLGAFVIVASVLRMIALNPASKITQMDMTYIISTSNAFLWTQLEACVAIICASLPTLKGPIMKIMPRIFGTVNRSTRDDYNLDSMNKKSGNSSANWKDRNSFHRSKPTRRDDDSSSQEQIIGITKTVEIVSIREGRHGNTTTAEQEVFRSSKCEV